MPMCFQRYSGKSETYITFHEYFAGGEDYEDDDESLTITLCSERCVV